MVAFVENADSTTNPQLTNHLIEGSQISIATHIRSGIPSGHENRPKSLLNPLLNAAYPLFSYASRLQLFPQEIDVAALQQQLCQAIEGFEQHSEKNTLRNEHILLGRYFLCALLDDVLEHHSQAQSWLPYSLLTLYYQESLVDYRIFNIIDHLKEQPAMNLFLLEMAYMIFVYGYQGIYRLEPQGSAVILEKMDELYHLIRWQRGDFRKNLFLTLSYT